jgi:hypothetical protein
MENNGEKDSLFNKYCWENWISACKRLKLVSCLSPRTISIQSGSKTLIQGLKLQGKVGNILEHIGIGNNFLNRTAVT